MADLATLQSWSPTWDTSGFKDFGTFTVAGALALTSSDADSTFGGCSQGLIVADGTDVPTFDGSPHPNWNNTAGAKNAVFLMAVGYDITWVVSNVATTVQSNAMTPGYTLAASPSSVGVGSPTTITATINGGPVSATSALVVTLVDSLTSAISGTLTIASGSTTGTATVTPSAAGTHAITATHTGGGFTGGDGSTSFAATSSGPADTNPGVGNVLAGVTYVFGGQTLTGTYVGSSSGPTASEIVAALIVAKPASPRDVTGLADADVTISDLLWGSFGGAVGRATIEAGGTTGVVATPAGTQLRQVTLSPPQTPGSRT